MSIDKDHKLSGLKLARHRIKNGLILFSIRNLLTRVGLDISPYYWVQEGLYKINKPPIKGDFNDYSIEYLSLEDVERISDIFADSRGAGLVKGFQNGEKCIGLKHGGNVAAFMCIEFRDFKYQDRLFKLKDNEAYLFNMFTFDEFRGKNLAPYLRYCSYEVLKKEGKDTFYSTTAYFNNSAIKFKKKLKAKRLKLYLSIKLFKKFHWSFLVKKYSN